MRLNKEQKAQLRRLLILAERHFSQRMENKYIAMEDKIEAIEALGIIPVLLSLTEDKPKHKLLKQLKIDFDERDTI